jgi:aminopeptidase N
MIFRAHVRVRIRMANKQMRKAIDSGGSRLAAVLFILVMSLVPQALFAQAGTTGEQLPAPTAQLPIGIPRELARERAGRLNDVHYLLRYSVVPKAASTEGHAEIGFLLKDADPNAHIPLLLDFRDGQVSQVSVNGSVVKPKIENGHIELPGAALMSGPNRVAIDFSAPIATAGKAITRFEDKDDGNEYIYTLFVPMDAEMAFPCFDQPDVKGKFTLQVHTPLDWTVISNTKGNATREIVGGNSMRRHEFAETEPISTYLFAFAAGPFKKINDRTGLPGLYVRKSKAEKAQVEAAQVQQVTADGIKYLSKYFDQPFPFRKYDMVMLPGFAYGGMEHAGATFLREEAILFRQAPTHSDLLNRDILLLHELTHQWFGDLATMRWFDDLWLKEGFAQYMAFHALNGLKPDEHVWKRFYQALKPAAYAIDETQGTTPIYQNISNLKDAKSAYGAIVYSKAPGVIKQLAYVLGEDKFRDGLRLYLKDHAYANAEWADLVGAFEKVSGKKLGPWADAYIKRRGMPQVDVAWSCNPSSGMLTLTMSQKDVLGEGGLWPISTEVLIPGPSRAGGIRVDFQSQSKLLTLPGVSRTCPAFVFANDHDYAYGRFLLDERSRKAVMAKLGSIDDVFERTLLWGSLWSSVREAELDPREYIRLALGLVAQEQDEALAQSIIFRTVAALHYYVSPATREQLMPRFESIARDQMLHSPKLDLRITWFRAMGAAETESGRQTLKDLLSGKVAVSGLNLRPLDRWGILGSLIALNDKSAETLLAEEEKRDQTGDGKKYAYMVKAARPDAKSKQEYFDGYLHDAARPEDWVEGSLGSFNEWNQSELTFPYLQQALAALPQMKRERKIFFVLGWLGAFIGGQNSAAAQAEVREFLKTPGLDPDLRLKILEVEDGLDRTVRIRGKFDGN